MKEGRHAMSESHPHKTRTSVYEVAINFGDCDPAGIVFFSELLQMDGRSLSELLCPMRYSCMA